MKKQKNITLKRILKAHKENPKDKKLHQKIENGSVDNKEIDKVVKKATEQDAFDKQR